MRLAARLLIKLRELTKQKNASLTSLIDAVHFDVFVEAAIEVCEKSTVSDEMAHPSTALKIGYDLTRLASTKLGIAAKLKDRQWR